MNYTVGAKGAELIVKVEDVGDHQDELPQSLQECAEGRCSCPTTQHEKVYAIAIEPGTDTVRIALKAKPGEVIDETASDKCMECTTRQAEDGWWYRPPETPDLGAIF